MEQDMKITVTMVFCELELSQRGIGVTEGKNKAVIIDKWWWRDCRLVGKGKKGHGLKTILTA